MQHHKRSFFIVLCSLFLCLSMSYANSSSAYPVPQGENFYTFSPASSPLSGNDLSSYKPLGFGSAASGGSMLDLTLSLPSFSGPVDVYLGAECDALAPGEIFIFTSDNNIIPLSSATEDIRFKAGTFGGNTYNTLLQNIPVSALPPYTWNFMLFVTPENSFNSYVAWITELDLSQGSSGGGTSPSPGTNSTMESEIKQNVDFIFGITSGFSDSLTEATSIFNDHDNATIIDPSINSTMNALFSGSPVPTTTITTDYGSGYTTTSGAVMGGNAQIVLSNIQFASDTTGADFTGTFNNVTKNGASFANGQLSGNILMTKISDDTYNTSGKINVNNMSINGQQMSGAIDISGTMGTLDLNAFLNMEIANMLKTTGDITLSFTNFISGAYTINSGTVHIINNESGQGTISTNLQTTQGPVVLNMTSASSGSSVIVNTTSPGTAGPYTVTMDNVILDQNTCANYPTGGTISFTNTSTGKTGVVTFSGACNGTYGYSEQ